MYDGCAGALKEERGHKEANSLDIIKMHCFGAFLFSRQQQEKIGSVPHFSSSTRARSPIDMVSHCTFAHQSSSESESESPPA